MLELFKKFYEMVDRDETARPEIKAISKFFRGLREKKEEDFIDKNSVCYRQIMVEYKELLAVMDKESDHFTNNLDFEMTYKGLGYDDLFLLYIMIALETKESKLFALDCLLSLHIFYFSKDINVNYWQAIFLHDQPSNELLPSINARIIARLDPCIDKFLKENRLFQGRLPLQRLIVDSDNKKTQDNIYKMLQFYTSDKFTTPEQEEILKTLFLSLDEECEVRLEKLLKNNAEAGVMIANHIINNDDLLKELFPIVLKIVKFFPEKDLLESLTNRWDQKMKTFVDELLWGKDSSLTCTSTSISSVQMSIIKEGLKQNKTLSKLSLWNSRIGDEGAKSIGEALKHNNTLSNLYLLNNQIGDQIAKEIAEALKINKKLSVLNVVSNKIGDAGASYIAEALKVNKTLSNLYLSNNQIGDDGAKKIAEALKINNTLSVLKLSNNKIGASGTKAIFEAVISSNRTTSFECNLFSEEQQKQVNESIEANRKVGFAERLLREREILVELSR